jgi:hypothetical protein
MPMPQEIAPTGAYHAVMYEFSKIGLDIVRDRSQLWSTREQIVRIHEHKDALARVLATTPVYLRDSRQCTTTRETTEHWGLYLHSSFHMSELCRPAISPTADPELQQAFRQTCIENLVNTVEAWLGLNNVVSRHVPMLYNLH